jgi:phosphatidylserine decarboxylase
MAAPKPSRRPPVAREGWGFITAFALLALISAYWEGWAWSAAFAILALLITGFFRDPERTPPQDPDAVLAPADGRVVSVEVQASEGGAIRIFLSPLDVHINRSPVSGRVVQSEYRKGRFMAAYRTESSDANEQNALDIRTASGENFKVVQIAGVLARRIVTWCRVGDELRAGERFGLIQFGSRTDLHLPSGYAPCVRLGEKVRGGESVVARKHPG